MVGIGAATWDRFLVVPRYPGSDEKIRAIHADESAGGTAATALVALSRWGLRCRYVGPLGHDEFSARILRTLNAEGIELHHVVLRRETDGRRTTILVDNRTGERTIVSGPHRIAPVLPDDLDPDLFAGARLLHLDTSVDECALAAATRAKAAGLWVTLDVEQVLPHTKEVMKLADYVIAPLPVVSDLTGEDKASRAAYALHLLTGKPVIVTDGPRGCEYASEKLSFDQPAFSVPVVDSTGAGDVFHAAFIYGLLAAWDIRKTVRFCAWAAAAVCKELGGQKGIPSLAAIREFLHSE